MIGAGHRVLHDDMNRTGAGQVARLADGPVSATVLQDMCYGTVGTYDAVNQVIETTGAPDALPTGTPTLPAALKVFDRENKGFTNGETFYAIRDVNVHSDATNGQVDWVVIPTAAGTPLFVLQVDKATGAQSKGDPVEPTVPAERIFSAQLNAAGDSWLKALDTARKLRLWLPAEGLFLAKLAGSYDNAGDVRPLYEMQPPVSGIAVARVTTKATAANWAVPATPVPSVDGRATIYKVDDTGASVVDVAGVTLTHYGINDIPVNAVIFVEEMQSQIVPVQTGAGGGNIVLGIVTDANGIGAASWNGAVVVPGSGTVTEYNTDGTPSGTNTWYNWMWGTVEQDKPVIGGDTADGTRWVISEGCARTDLTT